MADLDSLRADCSHCAGLCCVATAFRKSDDFAFDRPAGLPCRNLLADFRCTIHTTLRGAGMKGCSTFDCFGAGQQVVQGTFGGRTWRDDPAAAGDIFAVFQVMRDLHEILWCLTVALEFSQVALLRPEIDASRGRIEELTRQPAEVLASLDTLELYSRVTPLVDAVSDRVRAGARTAAAAPGPDLSRRDLAGADLRTDQLRGARLRGAVLLAVDLRGVDLGGADLLGADLRGARVDGADLSAALYLSQMQLNGARGDARTLLPRWLSRPDHWA
jgi:hypothetical protein